jgi:CheY-like chemotaxis protein
MASTRMGAWQAAIPGYRLARMTQRPHSVAITSRCCQLFVAADGRECQLAVTMTARRVNCTIVSVRDGEPVPRSPLARAIAEVPASRNAAVPYPGQSSHMPLRCLLVDDNEAFLEAASLLLEREGVTVAGVASSIAEALRQARALRPDVILVDIGLGEESGFDLARLLAQDGRGGQGVGAEVILISTGAEADYSELIEESPAAGFLAKSELSVPDISRILDHTP